jgi:hypothetical protein
MATAAVREAVEAETEQIVLGIGELKMDNKIGFCIGLGIGVVFASIVSSIMWSMAIDTFRAQAIERGYGTITNPNLLPKFQRFVWIDPPHTEN